ncbi:unnamed protein product [Euphydryas editha]|uniref:Uncharacterized protein n=1 Tax=Euphydryas editha TaxID=104508 RepID=A0AAU9V1P6_EUPED|nr:unnamed protein product [Euphydryas editha]
MHWTGAARRSCPRRVAVGRARSLHAVRILNHNLSVTHLSLCGINIFTIESILIVRTIQDKPAETRLRWCGHIMRRPADYGPALAQIRGLFWSYVTRKVIELEPAPKKCGGPRLTWIKTVENDHKSHNYDPKMTQIHHLWKNLTRRADPNKKWEYGR